MATEFKHLFTPLKVGSMTVPNRLMTSAMSSDMYTTNREGYAYPTWGPRQARYHADRAKGGFGLIVAGQAIVHPSCGLIRPAAFLDEIGPEYKLMADMVHENGGKIVMQLNHNSSTRTSGTDDWHPVLSTRPSRTGKPAPGAEFTKEVEIEEIEDIVKGFAKSARNMQKAGLDGVEIHGSHTYLLAQFMTPALNQRRDRYGGSLENRTRFLMETLDAVRAAVGQEFVVGVRINAQWRMPNGFTAEDGVETCRMLEATGKVDFLSVSAVPFEESMSATGSPFGPVIPLAANIKKTVTTVPIYVGGRIVDPVMAEETLANGDADGIVMSRASLADPELPNKAREGREDEIRKCVGAGQGCLMRHRHVRPITCTQNPTVGRETEWGIGSIQPVSSPKTVLVAGGGPAGAQAAIVAASRGHRVILCEKAERLGGQVNLIVKNERRKEFVNEMEWRALEIVRRGIDLRLKTEVTAELIAELKPDTVIVATGSEPIREYNGDYPGHWSPSGALKPGIPGAGGANVFTSWDALNGRLDDKKHVVIVDGVGYYQSSDPLEYLAAKGKKVTIVTMTNGIFPEDMTDVERPTFRDSIYGKDVTVHQTTSIKDIGPDSVKVEDGFTGREFSIEGVDAVVLSVGNVSINSLYYDLKGKVSDLHRIGDCVTPRRIEHAHFEGHRVGMEV